MTHDDQRSGATSGYIFVPERKSNRNFSIPGKKSDPDTTSGGISGHPTSGGATTSGDGDQESLFNNTIHLLDFLSQLIINQEQPNNNKNNTGCETWILKIFLEFS